MFDIEIPKIEKSKHVLFLGLFNLKSQAIFKKIKDNPEIKTYVCYKFEKEKEIIKNENTTFIPFEDLDRFLEFNKLVLSGLDYIIYGLNFLKSEINEEDYRCVHVMKYLNFLTLDQLILKLAANSKDTKILNQCSTDVYEKRNSKIQLNEITAHDAISIDGKTKSLGESKYTNCFNIRADVIGKNLYKCENLLENILYIENGAEVSVNKNYYWNGLTALEYASIIENIILNDITISNIQHLFGEELKVIDIYKNLNKISNKNLNIKEYDLQEEGKLLTTVNPDLHQNLWPKKRESLFLAIKELESFYAQ